MIEEKYIKQYLDVLDKDTCEEMIALFEQHPEQYDVRENQLMNFSQINLIEHGETWAKYNKILTEVFQSVLKQYVTDCNIMQDVQFPKKYSYEQFRLKKYEPYKGRFDLHTDVNDYKSAKRFLVFFIYLNSGDDGGTEFPTLGGVTERKQGSILVFPPLWTYPHAGLMPTTGPKYIVGSYLHYLE